MDFFRRSVRNKTENDKESVKKHMAYNKRMTPDGIKNILRWSEALLEVGVLAVIYYVFWRYGYPSDLFTRYGKYVLIGVYGLMGLVLFNNFEALRFGYLRLTDIVVSQYIAIVILNFITYWQLCLISNHVINPMPMVYLTFADFVVAIALPYMYSVIYHRLYQPHKIIMVLGSDDAVTLKFKMETRRDKYRIMKLISVEAGLERICREILEYDAVVINDVPAEIRNDILKFCYGRRIRTYVTPKLSDIIVKGGQDISLFDTPLILVKGRGLSLTQRFVKRAMDILICMLAMVILLPVFLVVAIAIKLEDGGPVFYKQKRATRNGRAFDILKFRSMIVDAEKEGKSIPATDHDPRITKVGRIIRATRIDELPQILNILSGDMSIVGPRPERLEHVMKYSEEIPEFGYRLKVKGGLTGYAQIYGKYNTSAYDKLRLDLMYIENYSLLLDIKLILLTLRVMLKKESTEGFDKAEELERMKQEALTQVETKATDDQQPV